MGVLVVGRLACSSAAHFAHLWASTGCSLNSPRSTLTVLSTSIVVHRFSCSAQSLGERKKRVVFLGTPKVAADVLDTLLDAAQAENSIFEIAAVVTQPSAVSGRGQKLLLSPVAELALHRNFSATHILCPEKAGEEKFLEELQKVKPDLCVTAAYGNILPKRFLDIPAYGTVNVHPSLLPLYRGAAPVQRALLDGVKETGVVVAYTVCAMDAGPVIAYESVIVDDIIKAPELLSLLFTKGTSLLLMLLPSILNGSAAEKAQKQDHSYATYAPKICVDEAWLDFEETAPVLHNKVRAFAGWPGAKAKFQVCNPSGEPKELELKIITTKISSSVIASTGEKHTVVLVGSAFLVQCGGGTVLEILELQPPGKRVMTSQDYFNGLRGQQLKRL